MITGFLPIAHAHQAIVGVLMANADAVGVTGRLACSVDAVGPLPGSRLRTPGTRALKKSSRRAASTSKRVGDAVYVQGKQASTAA
jgi:hypothetical protein